MNKRLKVLWLLLLCCLLIAGCSTATDSSLTTSVLEPASTAAASIAELWWVMLILGLGVFALVAFLLFYALFARGHDEVPEDQAVAAGNKWMLYGGLVMPTIILAIVFVFTMRSMQVLALESTPALTIQVIGRMWWWEVRYPDHNVITANEIHIPVGYTVEFHLTSMDVIHSFWVPELNGKLDMIPGRSNSLQLQADRAGTYRGICAEFCGVQHAKMHFLIIAQPQEDFAEWLAHQHQPGTVAMDEVTQRGQQVFFEVGCATCHAISGTSAVSAFGPNLTHFASRQTIGSAVLPNNRGNLAGWLVNAQSVKPGSHMPALPIPSSDLQALIAYLETLE